MTLPTEKPSGRRNSLLDQLMQQYPVFSEVKPLAIGIHKTLLVQQPDLEKAALRAAMKAHTHSTRYLKGIVEGANRYDLEGNSDGNITAEQQDQATAILKDRIRKATERRKEEEEARKHQETLLKLAEKFNVR